MGKFFKILLWLLGIGVVVVLVLAIAAPFIVDPNDYKPQIEKLVKEQTGRDLKLAGDLELSVFPWLGIETGAVALGNAPGFDDADMVSVDAARVKVKLTPLLRREVEVDTIVLERPVVRLALDKQGRANWEDLAAGSEPSAPGDADATQPATALAALAVQGVQINDGSVLWEDRQADTRYELSAVNLKTGQITSGRPVPVQLGFTVRGADLPEPVTLALDATVDLKADLLSVALSEVTAEVAAGDISARLGVPKLDAAPSGITIHTPTLEAKMPDGQAKLVLQALQFELLKQAATVTGARIDGVYLGQQLQAAVPELTLDLKGETLSMPALTATVGELALKVSASGRRILTEPAFGGRLETNEFNGAEVLRRLGVDLETGDPKALGRIQASADFAATANSAGLDKLNLRVDDSTVTGALAVEDLAAAKYRFKLALDKIDIDRYAPPTADAEPDPQVGGAVVVLPVGLLRGVHANGELRIGELKVTGLTVSAIEVGVKSTATGMEVKPMDARLYGGTLRGSMQFADRDGRAELKLVETLDGVDVGPLLSDMQVTEALEGRGRIEIDMHASEAGGEHKLDGTVRFRFFDGAIKGVDLQKMVIEAKRIYNDARGKEQEMETEARDRTEFTELSGTLRLTDQVARNDDLVLKSPLLRVTGKGEAQLAANTLDYTVNVNVVGSVEGQGGRELDELKGVNIPIRLSGPLEEPRYALDFAQLVKGLAGKRIDQEKQKVEQKLEKKLEQKLGDKLDKLFR